MQQGIGLRAPTNRAELDALMARRAEMQSQLKSADNRRFELTVQRQAVEGQPLAQQLDRTITSLTFRVDQLEKQIAQADELITAAHSNPKVMSGGGLLGEPVVAEVQVPQGPQPQGPQPQGPQGPQGPQWTTQGRPGWTTVPPQSVDVGFVVGRALALEGIGFLLFGAIAWFYAVRRLERRLSGRAGGDPTTFARLQQSVDAIALEVERISENQRYVTKVLNDKSLGAGEVQQIGTERVGADPVPRRG
jgi:hypothetical protein